MKSFALFIWEVLKITIIALAIVVPIRYLIFQPFFVKGQSMEPNFKDGDYLIVDELSYRLRMPERGEVIIFKYPNDTSQRYIKRIIGLPGEKVSIQDDKITITNQQGAKILDESDYLSSSVFTTGNLTIILGFNEYFVLGDNRVFSSDSRAWGLVPRQDIIGRALVRAWPVAALAEIKAPSYR